jgi:phenylacetaldehyde dehydrogenase
MDGGVSVDPDHAISHEALTFCSRRHGLLIGETFVPAASGQTFETFDPATGEVLASVPYGTAVDCCGAYLKSSRRT